jgi:hypothetical protein
MGSGFADWVHWHFFTITADYVELLLNDVCLTNLSVESPTVAASRTGLYSLLSV